MFTRFYRELKERCMRRMRKDKTTSQHPEPHLPPQRMESHRPSLNVELNPPSQRHHESQLPRNNNTYVFPQDIFSLIFAYFTLPPLLGTDKPEPAPPESKRTLQSLRLSCHLLEGLASALLFHTLVINVSEASVAMMMSEEDMWTTAADEQHLRRSSRVWGHVRCLCVDLSCYSEALARDEHAWKECQIYALDNLLADEAASHGFRTTSVRKTLEDADASAHESIRERFHQSYNMFYALLRSFQPESPSAAPSIGRSLVEEPWAGALDRGYQEYRRLASAQRAIVNMTDTTTFAFRSALEQMTHLESAIFCDSSFLLRPQRQDPHGILSDHDALSKFLRRGRPLPGPGCRGPETNLKLFGYLVRLPILMFQTCVGLRNLEFHVFPTSMQLEHLHVQNHIIQLSLEGAFESLESFRISLPQEPDVIDADYRKHHDSFSNATPPTALNHYGFERHDPEYKSSVAPYFTAILSSPKLKSLKLNSMAVGAILDIEDVEELEKRRKGLSRVETLHLTNISVTEAELVAFIAMLSGNLCELHMTQIHLAQGVFSPVLNALRHHSRCRDANVDHRRSAWGKCRVYMKDWAACDLMRPVGGGHLKLSTSRAEKYVMGDEAETDPDALLEVAPWPYKVGEELDSPAQLTFF